MSSATACRSCLRAAYRRGASNFGHSNLAPPQSKTYSRSITSLKPWTRSQHTRRYHASRRLQAITAEEGLAGSPKSGAERAKMMRQQDADFTEQYVAQPATETLFKECARQADYIIPQAFEHKAEIPKNDKGEDVGQGTGWWYESLGLTPTFNTWSQVTFLHMYLLTVRIRYFPASYSAIWLQHLNNHFFYEAEHRMTIFHQLSSNMMRQRYLKDLFDQWRGVIGAYDEGLARGDAVLASAVWRNVFQADEEVDWRKVALVVSYMRRALSGLDRTADRTIIDAMVKFGSPISELPVVEQSSEGIEQPFGPEDEQGSSGDVESK